MISVLSFEMMHLTGWVFIMFFGDFDVMDRMHLAFAYRRDNVKALSDVGPIATRLGRYMLYSVSLSVTQ